MADVIYKYGPFKGHEPLEFKGRPVHVGIHPADGEVYIWCQNYDPAEGLRGYPGKARIVFTGEEYTGRYLGTVMKVSGLGLCLVLHVIEVKD